MPGRQDDPFSRQPPPLEPGAEVVEVVEVVEGPLPPPEPDPARLQRERRELTDRREIEMRDVGGLAVEMVRRDRWNPDLLVSRAHEVLALEQRMHELDSLLVAEATARSYPNVIYCKCGAPLVPGVHFCGHCGRPARTSPRRSIRAERNMTRNRTRIEAVEMVPMRWMSPRMCSSEWTA